MSCYKVVYAQSVIELMMTEITSQRVYEKIDAYRSILKEFPHIGEEYDPYYESAKPPFPCRHIPVPGTPFTLYYAVDDEKQTVNVFFLDFWCANPRSRFGR